MYTIVTGGSGFVGSHLTDYLLAKGHKVLVMDNLLTGNPENLNDSGENPNLFVSDLDLTRPIGLDIELQGIFHFASPASPVDYAKYPIETLKVNSFGTHQLLEIATEKNAKLLFASTSEVYGNPSTNEHPQKETYNGNVSSIGPRSMYDEAKRYAEATIMAYHRTLKTNTAIARIFNTYGPRMRFDDGRLMPNLINQALKNEPLTVYGDGLQTRSFCYVSDLVEGVYKLYESDLDTPVNIGNPDERTVLEVAELIIKLTNSKSTIVHKSLPADDPDRRQPDTFKARTNLNWEPKVSLEEGLERTIDWYKQKNNLTS